MSNFLGSTSYSAERNKNMWLHGDAFEIGGSESNFSYMAWTEVWSARVPSSEFSRIVTARNHNDKKAMSEEKRVGVRILKFHIPNC